jgi:hypothetical protein
MLVPKGLNSAQMVFGDAATDEAAVLGNRVFLPVADDDFIRLAELNFTDLKGPGLFGSKDALIEEWNRKLGRGAPAEF